MNNIYEYIINFAHTGDIMNMLSVNKKFSDEKILLRVMDKKYPLLKKFKKPKETWRRFYSKMMHSINKLPLSYIHHDQFNPYKIYKHRDINYDLFLSYIIEIKDFKHMKKMMKKVYLFDFALASAVKISNMKIVRSMISKGSKNLYRASKEAKTIEMIDFFLKFEGIDLQNLLIGACKGDIKTVNYILNKGAVYENYILSETAENGNKDILIFWINMGSVNLNDALIGASKKGHFELVKLLLYELTKEQTEKNIKITNLTVHESLSIASENGFIEIVKLITSSENYYLTYQYLPMASAIMNGHFEIVKYLWDLPEINSYSIAMTEILSVLPYGKNNMTKNIIKNYRRKLINRKYLKKVYLSKYKNMSFEQFCLYYDWYNIEKCMRYNMYIGIASSKGNMEIINFFIEKGFTIK